MRAVHALQRGNYMDGEHDESLCRGPWTRTGDRHASRTDVSVSITLRPWLIPLSTPL
jgi:hypothetical protein